VTSDVSTASLIASVGYLVGSFSEAVTDEVRRLQPEIRNRRRVRSAKREVAKGKVTGPRIAATLRDNQLAYRRDLRRDALTDNGVAALGRKVEATVKAWREAIRRAANLDELPDLDEGALEHTELGELVSTYQHSYGPALPEQIVELLVDEIARTFHLVKRRLIGTHSEVHAEIDRLHVKPNFGARYWPHFWRSV
jgi:hypothetical protein